MAQNHKLNNGLANNWSNCFLNSTMQAVLSLPFIQFNELPPQIQAYFRAIFHFPEQNHDQFLSVEGAYYALFEHLGGRFEKWQQHDAHELVQTLFLENNNLSKYFEFQISQTFKCINVTCPESRESLVKMNEIFIQPNLYIPSAIQDVFEPTLINCNCGKCSAAEMESSRTILEGPQCLMLVFHLFPDQNTRAFINGEFKQYEDTINFPTASGEIQYNLKSFITHSGTSLVDGHFKAFVKQDDGKWLRCDDTNIELLDCLEFGDNELVYLQFYIKV